MYQYRDGEPISSESNRTAGYSNVPDAWISQAERLTIICGGAFKKSGALNKFLSHSLVKKVIAMSEQRLQRLQIKTSDKELKENFEDFKDRVTK